MEWTASGDSKFDLLLLEVLQKRLGHPFDWLLQRGSKLKATIWT